MHDGAPCKGGWVCRAVLGVIQFRISISTTRDAGSPVSHDHRLERLHPVVRRHRRSHHRPRGGAVRARQRPGRGDQRHYRRAASSRARATPRGVSRSSRGSSCRPSLSAPSPPSVVDDRRRAIPLLIVRWSAGRHRNAFRGRMHQRPWRLRALAPVAALAGRDAFVHGRRIRDRVRRPPPDRGLTIAWHRSSPFSQVWCSDSA